MGYGAARFVIVATPGAHGLFAAAEAIEGVIERLRRLAAA